MDELIDVVELVGRLNDSAESSKWEVARSISLAFAEFPSYHRGLTSGLCQRLRKSADSIYSYRNAAVLQEKLGTGDILSVSHLSVLYDMATRYNLSKEKTLEWLEHAKDSNMSVRDLRAAISIAHQEDERAHFKRQVSRVAKLMERIMQDAESVGLPNELWEETKAAADVVSDWAAKVGEWS